MSANFVLEIKGAKHDKIFNCLKDCFSVMGDRMDMIFHVFSQTIMRLLKSIFFSQNSKLL